MPTDEILAVKDLNVAYGESKVLFDISIRINTNELVACVGRNGAGKTTLLRTIGGFLKPTTGSIMFANADPPSFPPSMPSHPLHCTGNENILNEAAIQSGKIGEIMLGVLACGRPCP